VIKQQSSKSGKSLFLFLSLFLTTLLSFQSFKKVQIEDLKIEGSQLFSREDLLKNSSLNLPNRLIFIKTKYIENELIKNLSLKNISVSRQIFPFGLKFLIQTRQPIANGEKIVNNKKIFGFIDSQGFFIEKKFADVSNFEELNLNIYGWDENIRKTLSEILKSHKKNEIELVKISFSPNGFITLEEKDLKKILLGYNPNLIETQLLIIKSFKSQIKNNITNKIHNIDLIDPNNPKIKVFKP